ncbi:hypothetical protein PQE71_gp183 [Bacillus phage Izhevsk]|uniref:Uncharacterized protein n=1 Tax=Bacillus phage Izhevsk TaxID=2724322 RepID=A0A6H0X6D2_9CAUD|nr:hypothetical protein PQE71_gp183 [Bacillus phage Izhevsk]QIW89865.1 hypothetical protein Izhevsk_184 [Bacillus phage Izhevsk]
MRYGIGDIVKKKTNANKMEYYIVVDVFFKFEKEVNKQNSFFISDDDTKYTAIKIYPVEHEGEVYICTSATLETVALVHQKQHEVIMEMINRKRNERGMKWEAEYMRAIKAKKKQGFIQSFEKAEIKPKKKRGRPKKLKDKDDVVEYHKLETVDDCLDALNNLSALHKMFGDEAYIQLKEVVTDRLKELC